MTEIKANNENLFYAKASALESAITAVVADLSKDEKENVVRSILVVQLERLCELQIQSLRP